MAINLAEKIACQPIDHPLIRAAGSSLKVLRLDLIHPMVSGNKWFKLQEYLRRFSTGAYRYVLTFGGAYSNHLIATAAACAAEHIPCKAWVRGFHGQVNNSPTLDACRQLGMELHFVSRSQYAERHDEDWLAQLQQAEPDALIIPEGGYGEAGIRGAQDICRYIPDETTLICCAIGSGTTFCGIVNGMQAHQSALGFTVFQQGESIRERIQAHTTNNRWQLATGYHFGKFARHTPELIDFIRTMQTTHQLPLDFVYNAKMLYGLLDLVQNGQLKAEHILCIHTGGLQGNDSIRHLLTP